MAEECEVRAAFGPFAALACSRLRNDVFWVLNMTPTLLPLLVSLLFGRNLIAAVPSRKEGIGLSAIEAMAAGVPVVASRVDALQEVGLDGATELLYPADIAAALPEGLARLALDTGLRHAIGAVGAAHVARWYATPAYRASLAELLSGLGLLVRRTA